MKLSRLQFAQYDGKINEWKLEGFDLAPVNLLVGKNATGKSRTLTLTRSLAWAIAGRLLVSEEEAFWNVEFESNGAKSSYELKVSGGVVQFERFTQGDSELLRRDESGKGTIRTEGSNQSEALPFQLQPSSIALVNKRDLLQHPFLEEIHEWAAAVRFYEFGKELGRDKFAVFVPDGPKPDPTNPDAVVGLFRTADDRFPTEFKARVISYMQFIGYSLEEIELRTPRNIIIQGPVPASSVLGLAVKEKDLADWTDQTQMSQGMFRCLAIICHLAYAEMNSRPSLIIVDDIGEGLDYERSTALITLLTTRALAEDFQLLLSTNDRFVMNAVPLKYWCVLRRNGTTCRVANYANSAAQFDDFRFTGLNNFDFFATDFLSGEDEHEKAGNLR